MLFNADWRLVYVVSGQLVSSILRVQAALRYGHNGVRTDTTQQSGQPPDEEAEIKNITVYVSGYTDTYTTEMLSPTTAWRQQSGLDSSRQSGQTPAAVCIRFEKKEPLCPEVRHCRCVL